METSLHPALHGAEKSFVPSQYSFPAAAELFKNVGLSYCPFKDLNCDSPVINFLSVYLRISGGKGNRCGWGETFSR